MEEPSASLILTTPDGEEREVENPREAWSLIKDQPRSFWFDSVSIVSTNSESGWMLIFRNGERGWLISCCGKSDAVEHCASTGDLDARPCLEVRIAGVMDQYPVHLFIPEPAAELAVRSYVSSQERAHQLRWLPVDEAFGECLFSFAHGSKHP